MNEMERIEELKNDKEFIDGLREAKDASEMKKILNEKGIEISDEEIKFIMDHANSEEFDEEALENVSGGHLLGGIAIIAFLIGVIHGLK